MRYKVVMNVYTQEVGVVATLDKAVHFHVLINEPHVFPLASNPCSPKYSTI